MNSKHRNFWLLTFVSVLVTSSLACNLFSHRLIVPKPTETVPVTTEAAQDLENNLQSGLIISNRTESLPFRSPKLN